MKLFSAAISTQQKFKGKDILGSISGESERSRRRANEALWFFLNTVDVQSEMVTKTLFSCNECEVLLSHSDKM